MIKVEKLTKSFEKKSVLQSVNLHVHEHERCALVGRNGAGKSTLIHTILGLLPYKQGSVTLHGYPHKQNKWKEYVSYLPEKFLLYSHLTGWENMIFFASLVGKVDEKKIEEKLRSVSLWEERDFLITSYSKGMLQRLGLAVMLYYDTDIIILDEPTSGLDPIGRREILSILKELTNKTLFMASHHIDELKQVCTHVAFLEDGAITKYTMDEFLEVYEKMYI